MGTGSFSGVKCGWGVLLSTHPPSSVAVMEEKSYISTHPLGHTGPLTGSFAFTFLVGSYWMSLHEDLVMLLLSFHCFLLNFTPYWYSDSMLFQSFCSVLRPIKMAKKKKTISVYDCTVEDVEYICNSNSTLCLFYFAIFVVWCCYNVFIATHSRHFVDVITFP